MPETACEKLLRPASPEARARRLRRAAAPDCMRWLLNQAGDALRVHPDAALHAAALARDMAALLGDLAGEAAAERMRGQALRAAGRHAEALDALAVAADAAARAGDPLFAAQSQLGRIESLGLLGRHDEALRLAARLEAELRQMDAEEDAAKALVNAGNLHFRRDDFAPALDCYARAGDVFAASGNPVALAHTQNNQANILTQMARVDEAVALYEQAKPALEQAGMAAAAAKVDSNVGFLHYVSGRYSDALAAQIRARRAFDTLGQAVEAAKADHDLADAYRALNLRAEALECYERAAAVFTLCGVDYERAAAERGRAAALMTLGRTDEAFAALDRAEAEFRRRRNRLQTAHAALLRAEMLRATGRDAEAEQEARRALRTFLRQNMPTKAAEARLLLAEMAAAAGRDAARQFHAARRLSQQRGWLWLRPRIERALGAHYAAKGQTNRALRHLRDGADALDQTRAMALQEELWSAFLRDKLAIYEDAVRLLLERGRPRDIALALEYVERSKSRLLLERMQSSLPAASETSLGGAEARAKLAALRTEFSRSYHREQNTGADSTRRFGVGETRLEALETDCRDALRELEWGELARPANRDRQSALVSVPALRAALAENESLVEFYIVEGWVCAFVVSRQQTRAMRRVVPVADVAYQLRRWRYHLHKMSALPDYARQHDRQLRDGAENTLRCLYRLLLKPLEAWLSCERLIIAPHGLLHSLPFHAFCDETGNAPDRWEFVYAPSAAIWLAGAERAAERGGAALDLSGALLMGVPDARIPAARAEIEHLACLLPEPQVYCGAQATVATFREQAGRSRWIHLATHALFRADNPLFSALRFADGWLLARDLYAMELSCELAALSACRTGAAAVEPGDELFGLARGFLSAGVRSLLVSQWPADDRATALLMGHFYTGLANGLSKSAALGAAQRATRTRYPHPYYWAAFILVGER